MSFPVETSRATKDTLPAVPEDERALEAERLLILHAKLEADADRAADAIRRATLRRQLVAAELTRVRQQMLKLTARRGG